MTIKPVITRLALGTAQFGLPYGITNHHGQISRIEGKTILARASHAGIRTLDTAVAYGESEQVLGDMDVSSWEIVTKLPPLPNEAVDVEAWVDAQLDASLKRLRVTSVHGVLLHRPAQLLTMQGPALYRALRKQQDDGKTRKIGISIYDPKELDALMPMMRFDIVQAPSNVLDTRLQKSGWPTRLKELGCEVHARSVFLQGLLLFQASERPRQFEPWAALWRRWDDWLAETGLTALQACLRYALSLCDIDKLVVGVNSGQHLNEIINAMSGELPPMPQELATADPRLLNPALWPNP